MKTKQTLALLTCIFLLSSCGGNDSSSTIATPPPPPPPVATNPGGIWEGTSNTDGMILEFHGVFTETGEGRFYDDRGTQYIVRNVRGNDGSITMDFSAIAPFGSYFLFLDGSKSKVVTGTITGTIVERVSFEGDFSIIETGESGTISLSYDALYERDSSLAKLEGMWDQDGDGILTVDADGTFFEQNKFGCVLTGQVSIIDPDYNVYALAMTVSLCLDDNGQYTGLGVLADYQVTDDLFVVQMNSTTRIFTTSLLRL